jgi:CheY-like chemotaxis protein
MSDYVLVVDDHPEVRRLIIDVLSYLQMEGRAVGSGEEAIAIVQSDPPLAIVLDLMMPGMDGFSTITRLHREAKGKLVPIILLSAIALDDERLSGLPGVVSVIRKDNFTVDTFGKLLDRLLKSRLAAVSHLDEEETPVAKLEPEPIEDPDAEPQPEAEAKPEVDAEASAEVKPGSTAITDREAEPAADEAEVEEAKPAPVEVKEGQAKPASDEAKEGEAKPTSGEATDG